ncbi:MAG: FecR family protein, partial [Eubacteriales bacterium]|nr:FecR family protein [Eubacteriales bacterium]
MKRTRRLAGTLAVFVAVCQIWQAMTGFAEETYRNVKVLETEGEVFVERKEVEMPVYAQMMVQGGDRMVTGEDGRVDLQLDEAKYLVIEEDSKVEFELEGDQEKGAIRILLEEGAVFNEIEEAIGEEDCYEIQTPDGVMAVRGTKFRVEVRESEEESLRVTTVTVFEGEVHVWVDNEMEEDAVITAGEEAVIERSLETEEEMPWFRKGGGAIDVGNLPEYLAALAWESMGGASDGSGTGSVAGIAVQTQPATEPAIEPVTEPVTEPTAEPVT